MFFNKYFKNWECCEYGFVVISSLGFHFVIYLK